MAKSGILIVAYGLNTKEAENNFSQFCAHAKKSFLPLGLRHAFTSEISRSRLAEKGKKTDSVAKAIEKMIFENYTTIYIQSLHLISGIEYRDLLRIVKVIKKKHNVKIHVAKPLLQDEFLFNDVVKGLAKIMAMPSLAEESSALVYMAHGTRKSSLDKEVYNYNKLLEKSYTIKKLNELSADALYVRLAFELQQLSPRIYLACMKGSLNLDILLNTLKDRNVKSVQLYPFLSLLGSHTTEDMAGDNAHSWNTQINSAGFLCESHCISLLQREDFAKLWLVSLDNLINKFNKDI